MSAPPPALFDWLLRLGDSDLILSHRLAEWCGHAPALEEELALANVGLDLLGQARLWLTLAGEVEGRGRDEDRLAYLRDAGEYRNLLLVEQPNGHFGDTIARQYLFDVWHRLLLERLAASAEPRVAEIAGKGLKEVRYHVERSRDWVVRLGDGTDESRARMQGAIDDLWMYTGELFETDEVDRTLAAAALAPPPDALSEPWRAEVEATLREATLRPPSASWMQRGGKRGVHSEHLGLLLAEMQFLQRAYPGARW